MENLEKHAELTRKEDWKAICELNNLRLNSFGTTKEVKVLTNHLEAEEVAFALTSVSVKHSDSSNPSDFGSDTWLAVLPDHRFLAEHTTPMILPAGRNSAIVRVR